MYSCPSSTLVLLSKSTPVLLSKQYSCTPVQTVLLYSCLRNGTHVKKRLKAAS